VTLKFSRNGTETGKAINRLVTRMRNTSEHDTRAEVFQFRLLGVTIEFDLQFVPGRNTYRIKKSHGRRDKDVGQREEYRTEIENYDKTVPILTLYLLSSSAILYLPFP
jgi:hypothetical protein